MNGVEAVASWFTPTVLFCFLNLVIGTIFIASAVRPPHTKDEQPPQLVRVPSFFERVRSFNLSKHQAQPPESANQAVPVEEKAAAHPQEEVPHHVKRSKSAAAAKVAPEAKVLQKSASEKTSTEREDEERRRPATMRERTAREDEEVDEKANDFINRFRQQLRLQRLDSLLRGAGR